MEIENVSFRVPYSDNPERYTFDDLGMGNLLADTFKDCLRYVRDAKAWHHYDSGEWGEDVGGVYVRQYAKELYRYLKKRFLTDEAPEDDDAKEFIESMSGRTKRETIIKEAQDVHSMTLSDFDSKPYLLNCENGTLDLQTGEFRDHKSCDFLSKKTNCKYEPDVNNESWRQFISQIMCNDPELSTYLQKSISIGLSGDTSEECLFILYGPTTRNGKGTLMESILNVLGDYGRTIQPESLAQRKNNGSSHSADLARLAGIRFVNASEPSNDMKLNAAIVKQITGGDTVTTRFLYQNFFEYKPQFTVYISTNHLPEINDDSLFSSRRLRLLPFDKHFSDEEQDRTLKNKFREENIKSTILNWLLDGYRLYKNDGLTPPKRAEELSNEYRKISDSVGLYIDKRLVSCEDVVKNRRKTSELHADYLKWCLDEDVAEISLKDFVQSLRQKKLLVRDKTKGNCIKGYTFKNLRVYFCTAKKQRAFLPRCFSVWRSVYCKNTVIANPPLKNTAFFMVFVH